MDIAANVLGLLGVAFLAAPVIYAAKYGSLVRRVRSAGPIDPQSPTLVKIHTQAINDLTAHQSRWTPLMSACLFAGTGCAGMSYLVGLIKALS
jgi:hypothetical protein